MNNPFSLPGRCDAWQRLLPWQAVFLFCIVAVIVYTFTFGSELWRTVLISCWIGLYTFNNLYRYWLAGESVVVAKKKIPLNPSLRDRFSASRHEIATSQAPRNDRARAVADELVDNNLIGRGRKPRCFDVPQAGLTPPSNRQRFPLADDELPLYTILLPLRNEADVARQLMGAINALDYPRSKLQVLCLLRQDDGETLIAIEEAAREQEIHLTRNVSAEKCSSDTLQVTVLLLPCDLPVGTKPAACNWGLQHATGEILVIYDAEDIPEPRQLRDAAALLQTLPDDVAGVQSSKKVYNGDTNWLTRLYALEALTWHHLQLPGMMEYEKMAPLHGSGVHLRAKVLLAMNGWDYYNVAEDCDLGVRLQRHGYRLVSFTSQTGEEAPSTLRGWMGQRTRWNKGYIQSFLVHWRNPIKLWRELGFRRVLAFATLTGITWLNLLIGLPTWIGALIWGAMYQFHKSAFSATANITEIRLLIGSALILLLMAAALQTAGAVVMRQWKLIPYGLLAPFYWILLGIAVWRSLWQLCVSPFGWEKTMHG